MASSSATSIVDEYIKELLGGASVDDFTATFARATMRSVLHGVNSRLPSADADE
jgi:hypothetical protein